MLKKKYILLLFYSVFLFLLFEFAVRFGIYYLGNTHGFPPRLDCSCCWRERWRISHKHRDTSIDRLSNVTEGATYDVYDRTKGWNLKPGLRGLKDNGTVINSNSQGLRGLKEFSYSKTVGKKRIVVLGDSFTFGQDNSDENIFPFVLEKMLAGTEVLNCGVHGYAHDQMLLKLQEEGVKYNPDLVILFYLRGDVLRNMLTFRDYAKPRYVLENGKLVLTNVPVPKPEEIMASSKRRLYLPDYLEILWYEARMISGEQNREQDLLAAALVREMDKVCKRSGSRFVVVAFQYDDDLLKPLQKEGVECHFFKPEDKNVHISSGAFVGHWNPEGHRIIAKCIYDIIKDNKLLKS